MHITGHAYVKLLCKWEFKKQSFKGVNERPVELRFVFQNLTNICPRTVLDVGTGTSALPQLMRMCGYLVTAIDNVQDYWQFGLVNRHYHVIHDDITNSKLKGPYDVITCVSVLEHIRDYHQAIRSMFHLLKPGGHLLITFPFNNEKYSQNVYALPNSSVKEAVPFITQAFSSKDVGVWLDANNAQIVDQEYWQFFKGEYWTCGEMIVPPVRVAREDRHQLTCILFQKRP